MQTVPDVLNSFKSGKLSLKQAENLLKLDAMEIIADLARIDYNRYLRRGVPEIIYAKSKTTKQISQIVGRLVKRWEKSSTGLPIILSKVDDDDAKAVKRILKHHRSKLVLR